MSRRDRIELVLLAALWGFSFLFMRVAVPEFGAFALVEIRVAVAAVFLLVVLAWRGRVRELPRAAAPLSVVGAINSAIPFTLFAYAAYHITAGTAAVLNASAPLFGALVAYLWLKDKMTPARVAGLVVGFGGVLALLWDKISFNGAGQTWALFATLAASLAYGIAANYTKKKLGGVDPIVNATGSQIAAALMLSPLALAYWPATTPSLVSWLCVIALGILCTAIAYILYFRLIAHAGPAKAIAVTYLVPVFGMLWGALFLRESVTVSMIAACAIILLGTALTTGAVAIPTGPVKAPEPCPVPVAPPFRLGNFR